MAAAPEINFALEFPQGHILFMKPTQSSGGGTYFVPNDSEAGFALWGENKELFGKKAINVAKSDTVQTPYSLVYEFAEDGALTDARLVTQGQTLRGKLADEMTVQTLNAALAQDQLKLYGYRDLEPVTVYNVAQFPDGKLLLQISNKHELYLGTPGNFEKLDAHLVAQGGCSMYYKLATGESIELPWGLGGMRHGEPPVFAGEELTYLNVPPGSDPAKFGLTFPAKATPLNPFSPGIAPAATAQRTAPKAPGL